MSWRPTAEPKTLHLRSELLWKIRTYFYQLDFAEVQTPILSQDTVVDRHIDPVVVQPDSLGLPAYSLGNLYLQTSPEFAMKRLLAAGMHSIFQIGPVFRAGERGAFHNPEFTMLEWYRAGDDFHAGVKLLESLLRAVTHYTEIETITYQAAFMAHVAIDPLTCDVAALSDLGSTRLAVPPDWSDDKDDWLNLLFSDLVQPKLGTTSTGKIRPTIITHYPASQSALASISTSDPRTAERFELFINGVELANGYHELIDADELRQRNHVVNQQRINDGKPELPTESQLLRAMEAGFPKCSGCALGLDRLLMVLVETSCIEDVLTFPIERS